MCNDLLCNDRFHLEIEIKILKEFLAFKIKSDESAAGWITSKDFLDLFVDLKKTIFFSLPNFLTS